MDHDESLRWLYSLQTFGIKLGLENMHRLLAALDLEHPRADIIHVAGTNGKGSVCAMLDAIFRAAGHRCGLFTSPHLVSYRERIQVDGALIPEEAVAVLASMIREKIADWDPHPTFFEVTLAIALSHFEKETVGVIVLETGMGGRLDATNALPANASAITPIAFDHEHWLGDTLSAIASEKAGILKPGVPAWSAPQPSEAARVLRETASRVGTTLTFVDQPYEDGPVGLAGAHQRQNAALAAALAKRHSGLSPNTPVPARAIREGIAHVRWRARFERTTDPASGAEFIIDGGHNEAGAEVLVATWHEIFGESEKPCVVFGAVEKKDVRKMLARLSSIAGRFILTTVNSPRAIPATTLAAAVPTGVPFEITDDAHSALVRARAAPEPRCLVAGSLYLAGEFLTLLKPSTNPFEPSAQ
jgi:dihydrofolate synthase/folylpolyglutamate synthase